VSGNPRPSTDVGPIGPCLSLRPPVFYVTGMTDWMFLTNHARVLASVAENPTARLRDIAAKIDITERAVHRILSDLIEAGFVSRERWGARNRYGVNLTMPLRYERDDTRTIGDLLALLLDDDDGGPAPEDYARKRFSKRA
jgi:IclR helix-turn-helix domain